MNYKILLIAFLIILSCFYFINPQSQNLIDNPSFDDNSGWGKLWLRESGMGEAKIIADKSRNNLKVLAVVHKGNKDWSYSQNVILEVKPKQIYQYSGWIKCKEAEGVCQLSVITYDKNKDVLNWLYGLTETGGSHDWKYFERKIIIPNNCNYIQFRITGYGKSISYYDDLSLIRLNINDKVKIDKKPVLIKNSDTSLVYFPDKDLFQLKRNEILYEIKGLGEKSILMGINKLNNAIKFKMLNLNGNDIEASVSIDSNSDICFTVFADTKLSQDFDFPGDFLSKKGESWVIPHNEGLLIPSNDPYFYTWELAMFMGHSGLCMPFLGLTDGDRGLIIIAETPDDAVVRYKKPENKNTSSMIFSWKPSLGEWRYERKLKLKIIEKGGYVAIAKAYRDYVKNKGIYVTLKEKAKITPQVERLIGAVNIWWWKKADWWQHDLDCIKVAGEMKELGIDKILWSNEASSDSIKKMNDLGILTSRYDIYQDVWDPECPVDWVSHEGWPDGLVIMRNGTWRRGWVTRYDGKEYPGGVICSKYGFDMMKKRVAEDLKLNPYLARFIDTTTASPLYECYNPKHPLSRSGDREYKSKLLNYLFKEFKLVVGSETGIDWAVPYLHYFEGMMSIAQFRLPDSGYDLISYKTPDADFKRFQIGSYYRIPLFELVYHDCIVSYWYWGDSSNRIPELWDYRDLFNVLYGTGALWIVDPEIWAKYKKRFIKSYKNACEVAGLTGYSEMINHVFVNMDHTVQYTKFTNGITVWVNFGQKKYIMDNGTVLKGKSFIIIK